MVVLKNSSLIYRNLIHSKLTKSLKTISGKIFQEKPSKQKLLEIQNFYPNLNPGFGLFSLRIDLRIAR